MFAKAKEHLELECNSPNRKFTRQDNELNSNDAVSYVRLKEKSDDNRHLVPKTTVGKAETFLIKNEELNAVLAHSTKRSKSMNSTKPELMSNQRRPNTKLFLPPQSRQSELELVFQVSSLMKTDESVCRAQSVINRELRYVTLSDQKDHPSK